MLILYWNILKVNYKIMINQELDLKKVHANAVSSYLLLLISSAFLLNKDDPYLNNDFVKSHTKVAFLIHLAILTTAIVFLFIWTWINIYFLGYSFDQIIAISLFFILSWLLIIWITKAHSWKEFKIWDSIEIYKNKWFFKINDEWKIDENEKLSIILSKIPFLWFFVYPKNIKNKIIENNTKLNLIVTLILLLLYIFWNVNLANLLLLFYIIYIVFSWINLFVQDKLINIDMSKIPSISESIIYLKTIFQYLSNYFSSKKEFHSFSKILEEKKLKEKQQKDILSEKINKLSEFKLPKIIIYIPILNFISLFNYNTKQKIHIINWIWLSILFIITWLIYWINNSIQLLLLLPLSFGLAFLIAWDNTYKIPFLYNFYELFTFSKSKTKQAVETLKEKQAEEKTLNLKVED